MNFAQGHTDKFHILVAFVVLVFIVVLTGVISMSYCFCGSENEYTPIQDDDVELGEISDADATDSPIQSDSSVGAIAQNAPAFTTNNTKPTEVVPTPADVLAEEIDYFVRHMDHFYATGFYCSVLVLEHEMNMMDRVKSKTLREFVRSRPEFKMRSNLLSFKLTRLTPFREPGVQVSGNFQCIGVTCGHHWTSLNSFADHYQLCPSCNARVYPFEQAPLTKAQIKESRSTPPDANYIDQTDIEHALNRDTLDVLSSIQSPIKPALSNYQSIA